MQSRYLRRPRVLPMPDRVGRSPEFVVAVRQREFVRRPIGNRARPGPDHAEADLAASLGGRSISLLAATPAFVFFSLLSQLITFLGREPLAGADLGSEKSRSGVVGRDLSQTGEGPDFVEH